MKVVAFSLIVSVVLCTICHMFAEAAPSPGFLDKLFGFSGYNGGSSRGYYNGGYNSGYSSGYGGGNSNRRQKQGRSYSDICRVVNVNAYAQPGARVFPAQPFCPYN